MWMEKVFSSALEVTLKFCLHIFQPNPGVVGLVLSALGVHTSSSSSVRSPEQCDPHRELQQCPALMTGLFIGRIWPSDEKGLLWSGS